jgi:hypothetical protein
LINQDGIVTLDPVAGTRTGSWGGRREGAGRKREVRDPRRLTVDFEYPDFEALQRLAEHEDRSVASVVREAVSAYLKRGSRSRR